MFYFIISFMSFYCGAIIYNLPNYIIPSALACFQLGSSSPRRVPFPFWEWFPIIHFIFRAFNYPNCRLRISVTLYLFLLHVFQQFPDGCAHTLGFCFDVDYHSPPKLPPVDLSAPFDASSVWLQIELLTKSHYHFDFCQNENPLHLALKICFEGDTKRWW